MLISRTRSCGIVQLEPVAVAAEGVGEDDIGAGLDEAAMQCAHAFGMLDIPHFRRVAGDETHLEIIGAGGPIGEKPRAGVERFGKAGSGHAESLACSV